MGLLDIRERCSKRRSLEMGRYEWVSNKDNRGADLLRSGSTQQAEEGNGEARFIEARLDKASEKDDGGADLRR